MREKKIIIDKECASEQNERNNFYIMELTDQ